ncbi:hypothetical protein [Agromyces bauzanensis]
MLHVEQIGPAVTGEAFVPIIVALLTVAGAILVPRLNAHPDDLKRAESLTALLADLPPSPQRDLLEQVRDDHAIVWALRQAAPTLPGMLVLVRIAYYGGVAVLLAAPVSLLLTPGYQWWFWIAYLAGAALLGVGAAVDRIRSARRRAWMSAERASRGLRAPVDDRLFLEVASDAERRRRPAAHDG